MNKIRFKYNFIVFLYAYLRQIDLSLDRSRWHPLEELQAYYKNEIDPKQIIDYLLVHGNLNNKKLKYLIYIEESAVSKKMLNSLGGVFHKDPFLTEDQLNYCCQKLQLFSEHLHDMSGLHRLEIEKLRIEIAQLNYGIIEFMLSPKDKKLTMHIEHAFQNDSLKYAPIRNFIKEFKI